MKTQMRKVLTAVTVKNYAYPSHFDLSLVDAGVAADFRKHEKDICEIADYFLRHPEAGYGFVSLGNNEQIVIQYDLKLGGAEAAIRRFFLDSPYWMTIEVDRLGVGFDFCNTQDAQSYLHIDFSYFDDYTDEDRENITLTKLAPYWTYGDHGAPI
ncbi:MAG: hypothetical protein FWF71_07935 [Actinomycetia bacterium]|nr:hypothetical protein [Actinomycetes bacterium]